MGSRSQVLGAKRIVNSSSLLATVGFIELITLEEMTMNKHTYHIVDADGYILLTVESQYTARDFDAEAKISISPLLPVIANQYGLDAVYYTK